MSRSRILLPWVALALSCGAEERPITEESRSELFGNLLTSDCTLPQHVALDDAHVVGKRIAMMPEFGACIEARMTHSYLKCLVPGDPFYYDTRSVQRTNALTIMRSSNTAGLNVQCDDIDDDGSAGSDSYGTGSEDLKIGNLFLNNKIADGVFDDWERADVAGTLWHEAMHQQTYNHDDDESLPCGYPMADYDRSVASVPYMADRCMRSAGIHARVMAWDFNAHTVQEFGVGRHRAMLGHFNPIADNSIDQLRVGPGLSVRFCRDDGWLGSGAGCDSVANDTIEYGEEFPVPDYFPDSISWMEVTPRVLAFTESHYGGDVQAFAYGEHRANAGQFTIPNDSITSIYVPAGARVRACAHEGGAGGHGLECLTYDEPIATLTTLLNNSISYLEVTPVVTVFSEVDFYGSQASAVPGAYTAPNLGMPLSNDNIASVVVPRGLTAELCTDYSGSNGAGTCTTISRSFATLGTSLNDEISFLRVTPSPNPTQLTVTRATQGGATAGRVVSAPLGIDCGTACSGNFELRTKIRLRAVLPSNTVVTWTGCDQSNSVHCYVTMMSARAVTATFAPESELPCLNACMAECADDGGTFEYCTAACNQQCHPE